jgi:sulfate adenylyltransferase subunit 1
MVLPSTKRSKVKTIVTYEGEQADAYPGEAITITLDDEIDISRGDLLVKPGDVANIGNQFSADMVWMAETPMELGREYHIKFAAKMTTGVISEINFETDVNTLEKIQSSRLELNAIGNCVVKLNENTALDCYNEFPKTGAFVVIDRLTNGTVAAGMIRSFKAVERSESEVDGSRYNAFERDLNALVRKHYPEWGCKAI